MRFVDLEGNWVNADHIAAIRPITRKYLNEQQSDTTSEIILSSGDVITDKRSPSAIYSLIKSTPNT